MKRHHRLEWPTPANRIEHLRPNAPVRQLEMVVLRIYPKRMIVSPTYTGHVAAACGRDETGLVGLVLWADQIREVNVGDVIRLESGWCRSRDGVGRQYGKARKIGHRPAFWRCHIGLMLTQP